MARLFIIDPGLLDARHAVLAGNWWAVAIRGVLALLLGLAAFIVPGATILSLVLIFAAYSFFDGVASLLLAAWDATHHERTGLLVLNGLLGIAFAAVAVLWPGITVLAFVFLVAFWAIAWGIVMLLVTVNLRVSHGRWFLGFAGVASLVYGILLCFSPLMGTLVLTWWIGAYALVLGAALLAFAVRLARHKPARPRQRHTAPR